MRKIVLAAAVAGVFALSACKGAEPAAAPSSEEATAEASAPAADASAPAADASSEAPKM